MAKQQKRRSHAAHLGTVGTRAFKADLMARVLLQIHELSTLPEYERDEASFDLMAGWMLVPFTLWPGDFAAFFEHVCEEYQQHQQVMERAKRILRNCSNLPGSELIAAVAEDEHEVKVGNYDQFLTAVALAKYAAAERDLLADPEVHLRIAEFFEHNPDFGAGKNVLRRRLSMERNFRVYRWEYDPTDPKNAAQLEFDCLCHRFQLFGVERTATGFKPLLQKLSINTTPWGISIFIPRYWSFDPRRDIKWSEFNKVQRAFGVKKMGEKHAGKIFTNENAIAAFRADEEALADGLRGDPRYAYVVARAKLRQMSLRNVQKLISMGRKLCGGRLAEGPSGSL